MTKFMYIRDAARRPLAVVAYEAEPHGSTLTHFRVGCSVRNPIDAFDYELGRHIAQERMRKQPIAGDTYTPGERALRCAVLHSVRNSPFFSKMPRRVRSYLSARLVDMLAHAQSAAPAAE